MEIITINGSTSYEYIIDNGLMNVSGNILRDRIGGNKALIVCDENTANLFLDSVSQSLEQSNYELYTYIIKATESAKSLDNYMSILNVLSKNTFSKSDLVVAVGGGVVGDLAGFAAATYKRGVNIALIPTTLLSIVDSSIGGKTALNLPTAKNSVGVINNPSIVLCDPSTISSLSYDAMLDGYAEIIKYGILEGQEIIDSLQCARNSNDYFDVIQKSVNIKKRYIEKDEQDSNLRQFLNYGHLIGHALETLSNFSLPHGKAVAKGMFFESKCAVLAKYCQSSIHEDIANLLKQFDFDITCHYHADDLLPYILHDKRIRKNKINIIIPNSFGDCRLKSLNLTDLTSFIKGCL